MDLNFIAQKLMYLIVATRLFSPQSQGRADGSAT
jgi:hypothetical protein